MGEGRPRLMVVEGLTLTSPADPYFDLEGLAQYTSLSVRTLRKFLRHPLRPLPHYWIGRKILVRRSECDGWLARYRQVGDASVQAAVDDLLRKLR